MRWDADRRRPWAFKLYRVPPDHPYGRHLYALVEHCQRDQNLARDPRLGLPRVIGVTPEGRMGALLPWVEGRPLESPAYRQIYLQGLASRLWLAANLAGQVAVLHRAGLVHADLAEPNLLLVPAGGRITGIALIDMDGGGIFDPSGRCLLPPLVRGHADGSLQAPELLVDPQRLPDLHTDRWSLAVLIHRILIGGLDPFFWLPVARDIAEPQVPWPPDPQVSPDPGMQRWTQLHERELRRLNARLRSYFQLAFYPPRLPNSRPTARDWEEALRIAARWTMSCWSCQEEVVGEGRERCPFCGDPLPHARIHTPRGVHPFRQEGQALIGRDLGLGGVDAREPVLILRRLETGEVGVQRGSFPIRFANARPIRPLPDGTYALPPAPGRHALAIDPGRGRAPIRIEIEVPTR